MKPLRILACALLLSSWAWAQNPNGAPPDLTVSQLNIPLETSLPPVTQANIAIVGNPGTSTYRYWLVANYTFGQSIISKPFAIKNAPTILSGSNYVTITPTYPSGASSVDLLRTTSDTPPSGTGNYAVSTGNTSGAISDQGSALTSYTVNPANPSNSTLCLNNQVTAAGTSHLILGQGTPTNCLFVKDLTTGGTTPLYTLEIAGTPLTAGDTVNFNATLPAAPTNALNVVFQTSNSGLTDSVSAYILGDGVVTDCLSGTATWVACGGGSGGSNITVNGGSALTSPVNFQNGTSGDVINFSNPSGSNVQATIQNASITSAMLASVVSAASCTLCNLTVNAEGQVTALGSSSAGSGTAEQVINLNTATVTTNTNTTSAQNLMSYTFAAGKLNTAGLLFKMTATGTQQTPNSGTNFNLIFNATSVAIPSPTSQVEVGFASTALVYWSQQFLCYVGTAGASGSITCQGISNFSNSPPNNQNIGPTISFTISPIDLTATETFQWQNGWTAASASNVTTQNSLLIEILNAANSGGGLSGGGTSGYIPEWSTTSSLGNSPFLDSSGRVYLSEPLWIGNGALSVQAVFFANSSPTIGCTASAYTTFADSLPTCYTARAELSPVTYNGGIDVGVYGEDGGSSSSPTSVSPLIAGVYGFAAGNGTGSGGANQPFVSGTVGVGQEEGGATVTNLDGVTGIAQAAGAPTSNNVTTMAGVDGQIQNTTSGHTEPFGAALYARSPVLTGGAITNIYGLYVADQTTGGANNPNPHSVYQVGSAPNYFAAPIDVLGTSAPANPASGNARLYFDSGTTLLTCLTSTGGNCMPGGGGGGNVTTSGSPASGNLTEFSGATSITNGNLSGDVTTSNTLATTVVALRNATLPTLAAATGLLYDTAGTLSLPGTLPTAAQPAHTGDATNSAGSLAMTVVALRNAALPTIAAATGLLYDTAGTLSLPGTLPTAAEPAHTGDATNSAGALAMTVVALRNAALPTIAAATGLLYDTAGTLSLPGTLPTAAFPTLTGDISTPGASLVTTLATVNSNVGSFTCSNITANAKGLITAVANGTCGGSLPMTTLGDTLYENATPAPARLAGNTSTTMAGYTQTGTGSLSAAPGWTLYAGGGASPLSATVSGSLAQSQIFAVNASGVVVNSYQGINVDAQTTDYTFSCPTDRLGEIEFDISTAHGFYLPQAGSSACTGSSMGMVVRNTASSSAALTVCSGTGSSGSCTAGASQFLPEGVTSITVPPGAALFIYSDATSSTGNYHDISVSTPFGGVNEQTSSYTLTLLDKDKIVVMNCTAACVATLPSTPPNTRWNARILSIGSTLATVSLNSLNFNGAATAPTLTTGQSIEVATDGSNYFGDVQTGSIPSGANAALSNLASVSINTSLLAQTGVDLGSTSHPFRNLYLFGSGTYGTDSWEFTGTPTANRTLTLPDASGTFALLTGTQYGVKISQGTTAQETSVSLVAGQILQGSASAPTATYTPTLGVSGTAGTISLFPASGNFQTTLGSAATASNTVNFFASVPTNLHMFYCAVSSTTCTFTDTGYAYNAIPNADVSGLGALALANYPTTGVVYSSGSAFSAATAAQIGAVLNITQYDVLYSNGTAAAPLGAAINGFQYDSTSGVPAAATSAQLVTLLGSTAIPSPGAIGGTTPAAGSFTTLTGTTINTTTHCAGAGTAANPSVASCSAAAAGFFSCATNASTGTCVVDTTAVTANSVIQIQPDSSLGTALSVTCNTTADSALTAPRVSARSAGTSFTITMGTYTTNPECFSYVVID